MSSTARFKPVSFDGKRLVQMGQLLEVGEFRCAHGDRLVRLHQVLQQGLLVKERLAAPVHFKLRGIDLCGRLVILSS